jgi:FAD/FMN-containing dehydrogenase
LELPADPATTVLPYGLGRSYGDSCLNDGNAILLTRPLDRFLRFDPAAGVVTCEAGVSFAEVLRLIVPQGWFLPVTPGTKFVTAGGAVANDVHGKNHHRDGTFGHAVECFELLRSDGSRRLCSRTENADFFRATIGGLGLTGLITWVRFRLKRIQNPLIAHETIRFGDLGEFFRLSALSAAGFDYSMAWVDCLARGKALGRGLFMRGNHAPAQERGQWREPRAKTVPFSFPAIALSRPAVTAFNLAYYNKQWANEVRAVTHFDPFFYPLDAVLQWNRIYGRRGFYQYQCVVPFAAGTDATRAIIDRIAAAGTSSFLTVLKTFGDLPSVGMLSFPRPGVTLAFDFPNTGPKVLKLLASLDDITMAAGGAVYPAKDARMSSSTFLRSFPAAGDFVPFIDPRFSSSFWRRVTEAGR